jgi:hypothetical protein
MKPENKGLLVIVAAVVAVAGVGGGYLLVTPSGASTLIVPSGTVFPAPSTSDEFIFNVSPPGGVLVGAWFSTGPTCVMLFPPGFLIPRAVIEMCIAQSAASGMFNTNLESSAPGQEYTLAFLSDTYVTVTVTQTIEVVY